MTTSPSSAAGIGLPNPTRRLFLRSAMAAAAALPVAYPATVSAAPTAGSTASALAMALGEARRSECPELLKVGADLALAQRRLADARAALEVAREAALKMAPAIPEGLPVPFGHSIFGQVGWYCLPEPTDILGNPIELPRFVSPRTGKAFPVKIPRPADVLSDRRKLGRLTAIPPWQKGEHRRLYDLAVRYENEIDQAREASGLDDAEWEELQARIAIIGICRKTREIEAGTILGIAIKAQAISVCQNLNDESARSVAHIACHSLAAAVCGVLIDEVPA